MDYIKIEVPDMNDSISSVTLSGNAYRVRFTYNDTYDYWTFGLYDGKGNPIALGMKIVPIFTLNMFFGINETPIGAFGCRTRLERIGRKDFVNGNASFVYVPAIQEG